MQRSVRNLKIKILTTEPFPIGLAASNRIMTYAKGFVEQNCEISIHCIKPTERPGKIFNHSSSGMIDGIYYSYSGGKTILDPHFINRRIDNFIGLAKISYELLKEKKKNKTDVIIYYSPLPITAILLYLITRFRNILFLKEESEIPEVYLRKMNFTQKIFFKKLHYPLFDGLLLMTNRLIHHFEFEKKSNIPFLHVPMTVDFERFCNVEKSYPTVDYIAYCGGLNDKKDGINILINAFARLSGCFPNIRLYLIGDTLTQSESDQYIKQVSQNKLSDRVIFTGRVSKNEIPKLLANALLLVLPRPSSLQAEAGFPTKLGEYLSTGKPVLVTKVGEIPLYLTDQVNAFMAEPGNAESLFSKMKCILMDYPKAEQIGKKGKEVVIQHFNYQQQTKDIINFIKSFNKCAV